MCVKLENCDWWQTEFNVFDGKILFRGKGNDCLLYTSVNPRIYRTILTLVLGLFLSVGAYAQNITVKGTVTDATGEPVTVPVSYTHLLLANCYIKNHQN